MNRGLWRALIVLLAVAGAVILYRQNASWQTPDQLLTWGAGYGTAVLIIAIITASLTCGITASWFLILTPLLFAPHWSALITTIGFALGTLGGYCVARFVGGAWAARFRDRRAHRFLLRHSSLLALFGVRLAPASPHSLISYAAGLAHVPLPRLLLATIAALAVKSYVYASAVRQTINAQTAAEAINATTLLWLVAIAALSIIGHLLTQRYSRRNRAGHVVGNQVSLEKS
ncbi:MAG: VTT domain-containing protein [Pyrinomonadaceae bacterium]|nr:VTT domain-containing protein [Pyrinomonadaceae bacterium]